MPKARVLDSVIHYENSGSGTPLVFLHGSPGSSYLWRNVMPRVGPGRRLAPDLIGMGQSGKPDIPYLFADHARYLDAWFDALELGRVVLIGHDWGGALAFDWAARHPEQVLGIAFMESIVKPMDWEELSLQARQRQEALRVPGADEETGLQQDLIVCGAFTRAVLNPVSDEDLETYLAPYETPGKRPPPARLSPPDATRRRTPRAHRAHRSLRRLAEDQRRGAQATHDLRRVTYSPDRQAAG
jgi:haloalkane dehalogenase